MCCVCHLGFNQAAPITWQTVIAYSWIHIMRTPSETLRDRWLEALLPMVETHGWSEEAARSAAKEAGLDAGEQALAAPSGLNDLIDHFFEQAAETMLADLATHDLDALRVHEKVAAGIKAWLTALEPNKAAVSKAAARGMMPWGAGAAVNRIWKVADLIWESAGDTATDYNRQTKRALLSAVLPSIVLRWLVTEDEAHMDALIMRRLKQAMKLGQSGSKLIGPLLDMIDKRRP